MLYEENKTKKFVVITIILVVLIAAAFVYQQKAIMSLKKEIINQKSLGLKNLSNTGINSSATVLTVKKNLEDFEKDIKGTIISKSDADSSMTVKAKVVDFSKLSGLTEEQLNQNIDSFPKIEKNYVVLVDSNTKFDSLKWPDLKEGMTVVVKSKDSIYKSERISALSISSALDPSETPSAALSLKDQILQTKSFTGKIEEIGDNFLIVSSNLVDIPKVADFENFDARSGPKTEKKFKVFVDTKTDLSGKKFTELQVGSPYRITSPVSIYSNSEFTATKIVTFAN